MVEALYDCDPDHPDELGFKEGEKIVVTKKMSKDWWVSDSICCSTHCMYACVSQTHDVHSILLISSLCTCTQYYSAAT